VGNIDLKEKPILTNPKTYNNNCISFQYPQNWNVVTKPVKTELGFYLLSIRSSSGGTLVCRIYFDEKSKTFSNALKYDAKMWDSQMESENPIVKVIEKEQLSNLFPNLNADSYSTKVKSKIMGKTQVVYKYSAKVKKNNCLSFFGMSVLDQQFEQEIPGYKLVFNSLKIN